ncbi:MAG: multidrug effflux MFS transporter [Marinomonas foliarum]|jgi:MFS transporter, DHA1 family, multidrug resistance protein|uniref:Bcr/CflA family efflux transporter n=1 Tax=Marinomonas foliarum TaxID=491950 RepID=A0A369AEC6_9GAMM|nr:multidrug effflux MFS transporter [Marinomonas foliarum]QRV25408.1 multidrug effflux MFS transporter [Marinomonas foliarum]RCX06646.1 DHA1 family bicyclomycin/chloramphenicol resistance-like MFS transporter [Marinomonas foliarum]
MSLLHSPQSTELPIKRLAEKELVALFALMMSLTALSMDAMLPAFPFIAESLAVVDYQKTQWIVSAMILGMVFGEIFFGPLSDAIGRKKSILLGICVYLIGSVVALLASSIEMFLLGRMIQGFGVAGPKIASRALIRDMYKGAAMARIMSFVMMVFILVPMLAPSIGQLVLQVADWRWIFGLLMTQATIAGVWLLLRQPETLSKENRIPLNRKRLVADVRIILSRGDVMAYTVLLGCIFGGLMLHISTAQSIFQDVYDTGDRFPLFFAMLAIGSAVINFSNGKIVLRIGMLRCVISALSVLLTSSFVLLLSTFYFDGVPPFVLFMGLGMVMFSCFGMVFGNVNAMAMEPLGKMAGLGASVISSLSSFLAIILSTVIGQFYHFTVTPLASGFVIFSIIAFVMLRYGYKYSQRHTVE